MVSGIGVFGLILVLSAVAPNPVAHFGVVVGASATYVFGG